MIYSYKVFDPRSITLIALGSKPGRMSWVLSMAKETVYLMTAKKQKGTMGRNQSQDTFFKCMSPVTYFSSKVSPSIVPPPSNRLFDFSNLSIDLNH